MMTVEGLDVGVYVAAEEVVVVFNTKGMEVVVAAEVVGT